MEYSGKVNICSSPDSPITDALAANCQGGVHDKRITLGVFAWARYPPFGLRLGSDLAARAPVKFLLDITSFSLLDVTAFYLWKPSP